MTQMILWVSVDGSKERRRLVVSEGLLVYAMLGDKLVNWTYRALIENTQVIWKRDE